VTRLLGPDANSRFVYVIVNGTLRSAASLTAIVYSAAAGSTLADIATYDGTTTPGASISGSTLTVDVDSLLPRFWFPDGVDIVYVSVNGGTRVAVNADYDARLDTVSITAAAAETTTGAQAKADAAQSAAISDAATKYARVVPVTAPTGVAATDSANILAAIAALPSTGGLVQLQAGTYVVPAPASASTGCVPMSKNNSTLAGMGIGATTIKVADGTSTDITGVVRTPSGVENSNITFRDFTIDGNKANNVGTTRVIGAYCGTTPDTTLQDSDITFLRLEIKNCTDYGFDPHEKTVRLQILNCVTHDNDGDGCTLDGQYDFLVQGVTSYNNGRHGFNIVTGSKRGRIVGCYAYGNASNGFTFQNGTKHVTVADCRSYNNTSSGYFVNGVAQTAPRLDTDPGGYITFTGCTAADSGTYGWQFLGGSNNQLTGCRSLNASKTTTNVTDHYRFDDSGSDYSTNNTLIGCTWGNTTGATNAAKYGIQEQSSNSGPTVVIGCSGSGTTTAALNLKHATSALLAAHNGSSGTHPASYAYAFDAPSRHGWVEWNYPVDTIGASGGVAIVAGTIYGLRVDVQAGTQVSKIVVASGVIASALTSGQCQASVISSAGAELGRNSDISALFGSTGIVEITLAAPFTPTAGTTVAVLLLFNGSTPPQLLRSSATGTTLPNGGLTATSPRRYFTAGTSQTSIPSSVTMSGTSATGSLALWCALG
jgi:hypothetical protein